MLRGLLLVVCAVVLALPSAVVAHPVGPGASTVVTLESESGRTLPVYHHRGQTYALGVYGERYNIRVQNQTGRRVEVVVTVDGRDVISGREGGYSERGYLIGAYDSLTIEGFRTSNTEVAAFRFTHPGNSYSARMGTPQNVGVIGVAVFPERYHQPVTQYRGESRNRPAADRAPRRSRSQSKSSTAPGSSRGGLGSAEAEASASPRDYDDGSRLGTEYGESHYSAVHTVQFERNSRYRPSEVITLRYDDESGLRRRGIALHRPRPRPTPDAFPRSRYAPPPP